MPSPTFKGISTIFWGTDGVMNTPSGAIIESGKITPKNGAPIEIENNNGFSVTNIILDDGFDATFQCLWDYSKTWPNCGATIGVAIPDPDGNVNTGMKTFANCFVAARPEIDTARKKEATITYKVHYRPAIAA